MTQQHQTGWGSGPAAPGGAPPPPRRLVRRSEGRVIAGVAAGLADYFAIDPVIVRIVFVASTFFAGLGVILYLVGTVAMPLAHEAEAPAMVAARRLGQTRWQQGAGIALVIVALAILADSVRWAHPGVVWGVALIAIGVLLFQQDRGLLGPRGGAGAGSWATSGPGGAAAAPWGAPAPAGPAAGTPPLPGGEVEAAAEAGQVGGDPAATSEPPAQPPAGAVAEKPGAPGWTPPAAAASSAGAGDPWPRPGAMASWSPPAAVWPHPAPVAAAPRRGPSLGLLTMGVALLAVGVYLVLGNAGVVPLTPAAGLSLALVVVGLGLVVGGWWGRARWLMALGVLLLPFVAAASLVDVPLTGGAGDRTWQPASAADVQSEYRIAAGRLTLDLSQVYLSSDRTVTASVGLGDLVVIVPANVSVEVHSHVGAGHLEVLGHRDDGMRVSEDVAQGGAAPGRLVLDLATGLGAVRVSQAPAGGVH